MSVFKSVMAFIGGGEEEEDHAGYSYLDDYPKRQDPNRHGSASHGSGIEVVDESDEDEDYDEYEEYDEYDDDEYEQEPEHNVKPVIRAGDTISEGALSSLEPITISPKSFGEAKILADEFGRGNPVVMDLQGLDKDLARRLIDFASGICYARSGGMEKVARQVFLLLPKSVEVSARERRLLERRYSS